MKFIETTVVNCKKASILKVPWATQYKDVVCGTVQNGDTVEINPEVTCYDWTDRKYYRTRRPKGWIHSGVISYREEE